MSSRDNLANPRQSFNESRRVERDARRSGQEYQALRSGAHRVITAAGDPLAALGHIGARSGLLLNVGGEWRTVQEHIDARITTAFEYPVARIENLEASMNNFGPRLGAAEGELAGVPGLISSSHEYPNARIGNLESSMNNFGPRVGALEGDVSDIEADIGGIKSTNTSQTSKINTLIDRVNELEADMRAFHPSKPYNPPIVKG